MMTWDQMDHEACPWRTRYGTDINQNGVYTCSVNDEPCEVDYCAPFHWAKDLIANLWADVDVEVQIKAI
jgi:hypothetical protein